MKANKSFDVKVDDNGTRHCKTADEKKEIRYRENTPQKRGGKVKIAVGSQDVLTSSIILTKSAA